LESEGLVKNGELHQAGYGGFLILPVVWSLKHFRQRSGEYFKASEVFAEAAKIF
jgi:hypothetical protein